LDAPSPSSTTHSRAGLISNKKRDSAVMYISTHKI
jgi:hypothetical protein